MSKTTNFELFISNRSKVFISSLQDQSGVLWIHDNSVDLFLDKSILLIGSSNCGKSTMISDILVRISLYVPLAVVFMPKGTQASYKNILSAPDVMVRYDTPTNDTLQRIFNQQALRVAIYLNIQNIDFMKKLANKLDLFSEVLMQNIHNSFSAFKNALLKNTKITVSLSDIKNRFAIKFLLFIRARLTRDRDRFLSDLYKSILTSLLLAVVNTPNLCPRLCIVIDDYSKNILALMKSTQTKSSALTDIVNKGRHQYITLIVVSHSRNDVKKAPRLTFQTVIYATKKSITTDKVLTPISLKLFDYSILKWKNNANGMVTDTEPPPSKACKFTRVIISKYKLVVSALGNMYAYLVDYDKLSKIGNIVGCKYLRQIKQALDNLE